MRRLGEAEDVALACHQGPDGDALGSMLALGLALRKMGKRVVASWGNDPFVIPKHYAFLPGEDLIVPPGQFPAAPGVMATFDAGSMDRLGILEPHGRNAETLIVIDHHASNDRFGSINLVDPDAAASAVVVYHLLEALGAELDPAIAANLYTGILTDTGSFKYRSATPAVLRIAADLLRYDIHHDDIARAVYDTHPMAYLRLVAIALERARIRSDASMIWTWITQEDLERFGLEIEDTEGLIDVVRTAEEAEVACVLKQGLDGIYKASLRSKGQVNVGHVAEALGGGGHAFAAGFTADGDIESTIEAIAQKLA